MVCVVLIFPAGFKHVKSKATKEIRSKHHHPDSSKRHPYHKLPHTEVPDDHKPKISKELHKGLKFKWTDCHCLWNDEGSPGGGVIRIQVLYTCVTRGFKNIP